MMQRQLAFLAALCLAASPPAKGAVRGLDPAKRLTQYTYDAWGTEAGLPTNTVNAILQSHDGYIWVGTYDGLARFDGMRFVVFQADSSPGLPNSGIRTLAEDREGSLWIGTNGGGLGRYRDGHFSRFVVGELPADDMVWALRADDDGALWVGSAGGALARVARGVLTPIARLPEAILDVEPDGDGGVWVGTQGSGLAHWRPDGSLTTLRVADGLPSDHVRAVLRHGSGLWIGTLGGGIARLEDGRFRVYSTSAGLPSPYVSGLLVDAEASLWLATRGGLGRFRDGRIETLAQGGGLPDALILALAADSEGNLWFGTNGGGLGRLKNVSFTTYTSAEGLSDDFVYPVLEDESGGLWAGTARGVDRFDGARWRHVSMPGGACPGMVRSLAADGAGGLWIGTYGSGVCHWRAGRVTAYGTREGAPSNAIRAVLRDRSGAVWVGSSSGLGLFAGGVWRRFTTADGLSHNSVLSILEARDGTLWVGTDGGGLCRRREGGGFDVFTERDGLASNVVLTLRDDAEGKLWIGTNGGLSRLAGREIVSFTTRHGLPANSVNQLLDDGRGSLWTCSGRGVASIAKSSLGAVAAGRKRRLEVTTFDKGDGLKSVQCSVPTQPAGIVSRDGRLWFTTVRGIASLDPARRRTDPVPPGVVVESIAADEIELDLAAARARAGTQRLVVQYTGLCPSSPQKVRFRFRLEGYDDDWIDAGTRRAAYYTRLPPGRYRFHVTAANADGVWNPTGASVSVVVEPRFYQTWPFAVGVLAAIALGLTGAHRLRLARVEARSRELEAVVEERTRSLREEKERAEEAQRQADLQGRIAEEANAMKTEFLGVAAHDLRNPLTAILGHATLLEDGLLTAPERVRDVAGVMRHAAERMQGLIGELLSTAALETGLLELDRRPVDLARLAATVVDHWQAAAGRKQISLSLAAPASCVAEVDERWVMEIVENLVSNAVKFSRPGGTVRVVLSLEGDHVRIAVADDGPGLTEQDRARLFGKFVRLSAGPTAGESSTGLGLSIVKRLAEAHGGRALAESEGSGRGATFAVDLPRMAPPQPPAARA